MSISVLECSILGTSSTPKTKGVKDHSPFSFFEVHWSFHWSLLMNLKAVSTSFHEVIPRLRPRMLIVNT